jgi:sulfatase maturation enzyme AslB (radical SAM superfamily)
MQKTNIIYLTTRCDFSCQYCYERTIRETQDFQHKDVTEKDIDEFLDEIEQREGSDAVSTIVIMGGEPLLKFDMFKYLCEQCVERDHKYSVLITTNGSLLNNDKFYQKFKDLIIDTREKMPLSLEISYDGSGHDHRVFPNNSPTKEIVENAMNKLNTDNIQFRISYTVHELNWKNIINDTVEILERYPNNLEGIKYSFAYQRLDDYVGKQKGIVRFGKNYEIILREPMNKIFEKYNKILCSLACQVCQKCDKSLFDGNRYLSPTKGIFELPKYTENNFQQF